MKEIHFTNVIIEKPLDEVWGWFSEPLNYVRLYPYWATKVVKLDTNKYELTDKRNQKSLVILIADKSTGKIDLQIGEEFSSTRLFPLDNNTVAMHIGIRWGIMKNPLFWFLYKRGVDKDFQNAKRLIERTPPN